MQKTAYEMRISDWSADVCSSDLIIAQPQIRHIGLHLDVIDRLRLLDALASCVVPRLVVEGFHLPQGGIKHGEFCALGTNRVVEHAPEPHRPRRDHAVDVTRYPAPPGLRMRRSEEHTSELQSLMRTSYALFCLNKKRQY